MQPQMVLPGKAAVVHILAGIIRRVEIKEGVRPVIVLDQHLKILVFYDCFCHSDAELGDERKEAGNVKGLAGKGFAAAGIAVADEL